MKNLKYVGEIGVITQFGIFNPDWTGERPDQEAELLLKVPGFKEITGKEAQIKPGGNDARSETGSDFD